MRGQIEKVRSDLMPLETQCQQLMEKSGGRTNITVWGLLALMSVQAGFLARLTFVDYSWDIMEPITYFVTYGTSIACFAYFVLTRQVPSIVQSFTECIIIMLVFFRTMYTLMLVIDNSSIFSTDLLEVKSLTLRGMLPNFNTHTHTARLSAPLSGIITSRTPWLNCKEN